MLRIAFAAAIASVVGFASSASDRNVRTIAFTADLPQRATATPDAAEAAYARLVADARRACRSGDRLTLQTRRAEQACAADIVGKVVAEAGRPLLTAAHEGRTDRTIRLAERSPR